MLIGIFGFYSQLLPLYNLETIPWSYIFVKAASTRDNISKVGYGTNAEPMESRGPRITVKVKERYLSGPTLTRPNPPRRVYIKTHWSKDAM